jgi:predicted DNA-binding WGR domain protein
MATQLPLFPETVSLVRIRPDQNEDRYYRAEVAPDLFGRAALIRQWGRRGRTARQSITIFSDLGTAVNVLATLKKTKLGRGYEENIRPETKTARRDLPDAPLEKRPKKSRKVNRN